MTTPLTKPKFSPMLEKYLDVTYGKVDAIEKFIKENSPVDQLEPMSPPNQSYARRKIEELNESVPQTFIPVGMSSYTCYALYKCKRGDKYFVTYSMGQLSHYARLAEDSF